MNSNPDPLHCSRRTFLKSAATAGAVLGFPAIVRAAGLNSRVQVAAVGLGGRGFNDLKIFAEHPGVKFVGLCEVDATALERAAAEVPGVARFRDYRAMLDQLGDKVDAITVGTPDHVHAAISIEAMKRGKHVHCQKPLTHTVWEARQMRLWAEKKKVVTQMGNQNHSSLAYRLATRLIKDGAIGRVREVHSWVKVGGNEYTRLLEPPPAAPIPASLDWNLWLGCLPPCEHTDAYHPFTWRDWQAFGSGALGDFGCHILDPVFTALGLRAPISVAAENSGINRHIWPSSETVRYVFPGNALTAEATLPVTWTDGGLRPERKLAQMPGDLELPRSGSLFLGERGNLVLAHVAGPRLYPLDIYRDFPVPKDEKGFNHWHVWIDAILAGNRTTDGFDYAGPLTETVLLGNVATRVTRRPTNRRLAERGKPDEPVTLLWDAERGRITNHDEANALLTKSYRRGWEIAAA
jgi:predicted dehydrogenase